MARFFLHILAHWQRFLCGATIIENRIYYVTILKTKFKP